MFSETNRRAFLAALAASGAGLTTARAMLAQQATPDAHDHDDDHGEHNHDHDHETGSDLFLLVSDSEAKSLSVYNSASGEIIETLEGVVINGHAGTIPLADGSVLLVDDENQRLLHIEVHGDHLHVHEAPTPGQVAHIAIESDHAHYCAVGTSAQDEFQLHIVDLESWEVTSNKLPDNAEVGLMLSHDNFFHRNSELNRLEAYDLYDLLQGNVELLSSVEIGTFGHGEAINEETGELFTLTDDGVDIAYWESPELTYGKTLAWPESDPASRGYFARLVADGAALLTYTADRSAPETEWHTWKNRSVLYDIATEDTVIADLPDGYVFRFALSEETATYVVIGAEQDSLITIDLDVSSGTFGNILSTVSLDPTSNRAMPGDAFYDKAAYRALAVSPDGQQAFVTQGGDGHVQVVNPADGTVIATLEHETPLTGGGTLAVFGTAVPIWDTIGR